MDNVQELLKHLPEIEKKIGYSFRDKGNLVLAFVHRSYVNEHDDITQHNERLEFLGDAILGLLITEYLYCKLPHTPEGELSSLRSTLVEAAACTYYMESINLESCILMSKGEKINWSKGRDSILANLFEALVGAIYLDGGLEASKTFVFNHFTNEMDEMLASPSKNWKAMIQDYCQKVYQQIPQYEVISEEGPDHRKTFEIAIHVNGKEIGRGVGSSKKEAQQHAARVALDNRGELENGN